MKPAFAIALVFVCCCVNVIFLEYLVKAFPGCGNTITFCQFLFTALCGFIFTTNFGRKKPAIPINIYFTMVAIFFVVQVVNNVVFAFHISMPLHMIFRSGSLIANLVLGVIILKKRYNSQKYLSVLMITVGICICTIVSIEGETNNSDSEEEEDALHMYFRWAVGISLLTFALFISAYMGIYQEQVYTKHGKHPSEALFYNHALPLPGFLLLTTDIYNHMLLFNNTDPVNLPVIGIGIPYIWLFLLCYVITYYFCINGVFILTTECASLTVTLVVTLRKFVSLLISIYYFQNPFTFYHWIGTALVFGGTLVFTDAFTLMKDLLLKSKKKTS